MRFEHALVWSDATSARVLYFEDQTLPIRRFAKAIRLRAHGASGERAADRLLADVCEALADTPQLLLTGTSEAIEAFERHVESNACRIAARIVGVQRVDAPSRKRLSALARWHFTRVPPAAASAGDA